MLTVDARDLMQSRGRRAVLHGLTFTTEAGALALLGPNGAGKTTLLETVSTILRPVSGSLTVLGLSVTRTRDLSALRRQIGFLPQQFGFFPAFSVREFVAYVAWTKGVPGRQLRARAAEAIERVDLTDRRNHTMRSLSGGMLRRAGIAAALVHSPGLLILDEPTVGLDPRQRSEFRQLVRDVAAVTPVILSTHLTDDVETMCTSVIVIDAGRLAFHGSVQGLADRGTGSHLGDTPLERGYTAVTAAGAGDTAHA